MAAKHAMILAALLAGCLNTNAQQEPQPEDLTPLGPTTAPTNIEWFGSGDNMEIGGGDPTGYPWHDFQIRGDKNAALTISFERNAGSGWRTSPNTMQLTTSYSRFPDWGEVTGDDRLAFCTTNTNTPVEVYVMIRHLPSARDQFENNLDVTRVC